MRRWVLLAPAGVVLLSVVALTRGAGRGAAPESKPSAEAARPRNTDAAVSPRVATETPLLSRDPFEYADDRPSLSRRAAEDGPRFGDRPVITLPSPTPEPVRLVGLIRRDGALRAALSIEGQVEVLGVGDEAEGYRVISIDEDVGVRLRAPDGLERVVVPAP